VTLKLTYKEASDAGRLSAVPMAHLSVEVGHLYAEDLAEGVARIETLARQVQPWVQAARGALEMARNPPRVSTCFLIDDYFTPFSTPRQLIPSIMKAYEAAGIEIDYIAREAGCAETEELALARLVADMLVSDPPPRTDGSRPTIQDSGWLANGIRSPEPQKVMAMENYVWQPPVEHAATRHSVFIDVQLWSDTSKGRLWSCAFLAAVWQLLRLGVLRHLGRPVVEPVVMSDDLPDDWSKFPAVVQMSGRPAGFAAYQTYSALDSRFLPIEHAVRAILTQIAVEPQITNQIVLMARREGIVLSRDVVDRIRYTLL
jgi:hypothetical protein